MCPTSTCDSPSARSAQGQRDSLQTLRPTRGMGAAREGLPPCHLTSCTLSPPAGDRGCPKHRPPAALGFTGPSLGWAHISTLLASSSRNLNTEP